MPNGMLAPIRLSAPGIVAEGQQDVAEISTALRIVPQLEGVTC